MLPLITPMRTYFRLKHQFLLLKNLKIENISQDCFKTFSTGRNNKQERKKNVLMISTICFASLVLGTSLYFIVDKRHIYFANKKEEKISSISPNLPMYTLKEVSYHDSLSKRIWVTYGQGVYDITDFVNEHPGGEKILMAAGGSVEPFWLMYGVHKSPEILEMLETYRIGNILLEDDKSINGDLVDPYSNDPIRHKALRASSLKPFNAEPPSALLTDSYITPVDLFYVRNHLPVPDVDEDCYELEISGIGVKKTTLSLKDIKKYPKFSVTASIQCAGNRRSEMSKIKPVKGLDWGPAAIGNATWSGARLYDVLSSLGLKEDDPNAKHIQFEGLDTDVANVAYGASVPIEKGMDPRGDVILAYEMNGELLTRDHGYPIRVIVPGIVGARNVKWLGGIIVSDKESSSHWQQNDYKGFSPSVDWHNVDFSKSPAIQELPVISAICEPTDGAKITLVDGVLKLKGYAFSGGGHKIVRVDVTTDKGVNWHVANITDQDPANPPRHWAWTLWKADIPVDPTTTKIEIWVKAVDNSYNTQPESFSNIWNLRGVLGNAYHRIKVDITP